MNGSPSPTPSGQGVTLTSSPRGAPMLVANTMPRLVLASGTYSQSTTPVEALEPAQGPIRRGM